MVSLQKVRLVRESALVLALACGAAAQTATTNQQLDQGAQFRALGQYEQAKTVFTALLHETERLQPESRFLATVLDHLGRTEQGMGNYLDAEKNYNRALVILQRNAGSEATAAEVETHLAEVYQEQRRPLDAEPLLRHAIEVMRSQPKLDAVALAVTQTDLAVIRGMQGKHAEAERLLRQALTELETELGREHPFLAAVLCPLTGVLIVEKRFKEAVEPAERMWRLLQSSGTRIGAPDMASALDALGVVYARTGRTAEAESYAKRAITMAEGVYGPEHPRMASYLINYAFVLKHLHRKDEAKSLEQRAQVILAQSARDNPTQHTVSVNALRE